MLRAAVFAASVAVVSACGMYQVDEGATNRPATPSPISTNGPESTSSPAVPTPAATASPGPSAEIQMDISGGPYAGSYLSVARPGCDNEPAQNRFTVTYASDAAPDGFVAFQLVLRDAALAIEDQSHDFLAEISLGGPGAGVSYTIDPTIGAGSGNALLETSPIDATLDLSATTPDGAEIDLIVVCDFS